MHRLVAPLLLAVLATACQERAEQRSGPVTSVTTSTTASRATTSAPTTEPDPTFSSSVATIDDPARLSASWRAGCPVEIADLRLLTVSHWDFEGAVRDGELVVHADVAESIARSFRELFDAAFPIERMELVDVYGGDDTRSMDANNTSAFNCRPATGSSRWSEHAYGRAIDINPVQNPYVPRRGAVQPSAGSAFVDRSPSTGVITADGPVVAAFAGIGWEWGGSWSSAKDYQHFSESGR